MHTKVTFIRLIVICVYAASNKQNVSSSPTDELCTNHHQLTPCVDRGKGRLTYENRGWLF